MQPGKVKKGDILMLLFGIALIVAGLVWVLH